VAGGPVAVGSGVAGNPAANSITEFLAQYFSAINAHDYQAYVTLLSSQQQEGFTESQFQDGYGSTTDSAETLTGISTAANGDTEATVTFTSNQNASQSVDQSETCTDWGVSLFLENDGTSYLIDPPPPGYHAAHSPCS
jgi:hypothetical protein